MALCVAVMVAIVAELAPCLLGVPSAAAGLSSSLLPQPTTNVTPRRPTTASDLMLIEYLGCWRPAELAERAKDVSPRLRTGLMGGTACSCRRGHPRPCQDLRRRASAGIYGH